MRRPGINDATQELKSGFGGFGGFVFVVFIKLSVTLHAGVQNKTHETHQTHGLRGRCRPQDRVSALNYLNNSFVTADSADCPPGT